MAEVFAALDEIEAVSAITLARAEAIVHLGAIDVPDDDGPLTAGELPPLVLDADDPVAALVDGVAVGSLAARVEATQAVGAPASSVSARSASRPISRRPSGDDTGPQHLPRY